MTALVRALAAALLAVPLLAGPAALAKPAAPAAKSVPTGTVCGTIRLDTSYGGPGPARLADIVRIVAVDADGRLAGRVRYGAEKARDAFRLLPYRIDGLPLRRHLTLAAAIAGPLGSPPPATGFAWSGLLEPGATTPHGSFALDPGPCRRADYALQLREVPPPMPSAPPPTARPLGSPPPAPPTLTPTLSP